MAQRLPAATRRHPPIQAERADPPPVPIRVGGEAIVFNRPFRAQIEKDAGQFKLLIAPDTPPADGEEPRRGLTVAALVKELSSLAQNLGVSNATAGAAAINDAIGVLVNPENLTVYLDQLFLYVLRKEEVNKKPNPENKMEYAFKISVEYDPENAKPDVLFRFKSAYFALWNSQRPGVVRQMRLKSVDDVLAELDQ